MPAPLRRSPNFLPGIGGFGNKAYDGHIDRFPLPGSRGNRSRRQDGGAVQFLGIAKSPTLNAAFQLFSITGQTLDSTSTPLSNCVVEGFQTGSDRYIGDTVSDGSGNYRISTGSNSGTFYLVAYKAGSPDIAGTTVNTLTAI